MKLLIFKTNPKQPMFFNNINFVYCRMFRLYNNIELTGFEKNKLIILLR